MEKTFTGAYIPEKELNSMIAELKKSEKYKSIVSAMKNVEDFNENDISVRVAYQMKGIEPIKDKKVPVKTKFIQLLFDENKAEVFYALTENEEDNLKEGFTGSIVHDEKIKITTFVDVGSEGLTRETDGYNGELEQVMEEKLPNDPNYNHEEFPFETLDFSFKGCMPSPSKGLYKHCGPGCGDGLKYGGGTPINPVDTCCRAHDRCWKQFGKWDCKCDRILIDCAKKHRLRYPAAYATIYAAFAYNAC